jgi:hypothetical protein
VLIGAALLALLSPVPPLAGIAAWLAWAPTSLLLGVVHVAGSLPGAAISGGRLPPPVTLTLALLLLAWGLWHLPELQRLRRRWTSWRLRHARALAPVACSAACLAAAVLLTLVRADRRASIEPLGLSSGQAVFIRGPTGRTALVALGHADAAALAAAVADHLAPWEHHLDEVAVLDPAADQAVALTLTRYPAERLVQARSGVRLDLGWEPLEAAAVAGQLAVRAVEPDGAPR